MENLVWVLVDDKTGDAKRVCAVRPTYGTVDMVRLYEGCDVELHSFQVESPVNRGDSVWLVGTDDGIVAAHASRKLAFDDPTRLARGAYLEKFKVQ